MMRSLQARFPGFAMFGGIPLDRQGSSAAESIALLKSRFFIQEFIEQENLLPVLFANRWDAERNEWESSEEDGGQGVARASSSVFSAS